MQAQCCYCWKGKAKLVLWSGHSHRDGSTAMLENSASSTMVGGALTPPGRGPRHAGSCSQEWWGGVEGGTLGQHGASGGIDVSRVVSR